eukprot:CAMPEP_0114658686 /NCGR_PEP_ID=MMETSP0191-20121206/16200_1 /TAXON_ID=126664 /ORGANISM="Sorites sp." /LENGTH=177 /DNA_ID=CAMNT_0001881365 /DNA_START=521 /DNA_END=1051 /DNA_ORIENTATION=-
MYLFQNGIEADDVAQGALGDCWLLAAIASLAEFPGAIERCFKNNEKSDRGKYTIKLYDFRLNVRKRVDVVIDDYIPCSKDTNEPMFSQAKGNEMWVLLLEKAFAKFCGGYSELKGGHAMWAMQVITGDNVFRLDYDKNNKCWTRWDIVYENKEANKSAKECWGMKDSKERFNNDYIW